MELHPLEIELQNRIIQDCYSTAYPWKPEQWAGYIRPGALKFKKGDKISFYIHIPFCKNLCKFCEYTRCLVPDDVIQRNYLQIIHRDIRKFLLEYPNITLEGFDIGGGTPSALSPSNFAYLMQIYREVVHRVNVTDDFEPSIEMSINTITSEKIKMVHEAGIRRISVGIQSLYFSRRHSGIGWKYPEANEIVSKINMIRNAGGFKINVDFMYGFNLHGFTEVDDLNRIALEQLNPDQVTVYELRTNQLNNYGIAPPTERAYLYEKWYHLLKELGYIGEYGQNTFSVDRHDYGVSSYIRHRMLDGADYKGFGISAQSMSDGNVEYNVGKNAKDILSLIPTGKIPKDATFEALEHYDLPVAEKFAKFVCVSSYSGGFSWRKAKERFYPNFFERFGKVLDFLSNRQNVYGNGDIIISNDRISVTEDGFRHYGSLFSLFYNL